MKGQWLGDNSGTNPGYLILNIDEREKDFCGVAILHSQNSSLPAAQGFLVTKDKRKSGSLQMSLAHLDPRTGQVLSPADLSIRYPAAIFPATADVNYSVKQTHLILDWKTPIGTNGFATLPRSNADKASALSSKIMSWQQFKNFANKQTYRQAIFRGQEQSLWRLRTAFHRAGRSDILRYQLEDGPILWRMLSGRTRHLYDLSNADQNGAFLHLAQHHGYPTPLLDWSYSPYVAAFCAFRKIKRGGGQNHNIRIFVFDHLAWHKDWEMLPFLNMPRLNISVLEFAVLDNERTIPQQALSFIANVDDIETYIQDKEKKKQTQYLRAIDIPARERDKAMEDLRRMGITAGSMFPGLDGSCEELKELRFSN